jgi:hypothetical protein
MPRSTVEKLFVLVVDAQSQIRDFMQAAAAAVQAKKGQIRQEGFGWNKLP